LRILASDVPSAGYKTFEIIKGSGDAPTNAAASVSNDNTTLENNRIKIVVDPDGAIASLIDKSHPDTELAATIDGLKLNDFAANDTSGNTIAVENTGPVSVTLKCVSAAGRQHTTRITLFRDSDRVEIRNEITENFADVRHWSFSFNLANPDVHTEELGTILHDKKKSEGGDYADTHARYDYATLNHFADITDGSNTRGVTLANADCAFVRLGHSFFDQLDTATPQLNVLAGGQVDGYYLGIRAQNGATQFLQRFALRPHDSYDPVTAMKFALEHENPLVAGTIIGLTNSPYPAANYSLLKVSNPSVLLWALKPHDDGIEHGLVARLWNLSDAPAKTDVAFTPDLAAGYRTTHIETDIENVPLTAEGLLPANFTRQQLQTYRLTLK
jgi:alpha-mannosidase